MRHFVTIRKGETTSSSDNGKKLMNGSTGTANSQKKSSTGSTSLRPTPPALANPATGGSKANVPALSTPEAATVQKVGLGTVFSRESASCKSSISNKTQMLVLQGDCGTIKFEVFVVVLGHQADGGSASEKRQVDASGLRPSYCFAQACSR